MLHFFGVVPFEYGRKPDKNEVYYETSIMLFLIIILYNCRQSGQGFREKTGSFRKAVKKYAEFGE